MASFLYIFRGGSDMVGPESQQQHMQKWGAWIAELGKQGHFKGGEPLDSAAAKVVRGKGKTVTDGPYAEAKDRVGGYLIVEANDLNHATELSRGCPIFDNDGTVEVRTILKM
jgi:hypothetical protein